MLSHGNILSNCDSSLAALSLGENDMTLSFLPIAHAFERTAGYYTVMTAVARSHSRKDSRKSRKTCWRSSRR